MHRRGFERFLRKLLKQPGKPALLYLHVYQPVYMGYKFWLGAEMEQNTILQYYRHASPFMTHDILWVSTIAGRPGTVAILPYICQTPCPACSIPAVSARNALFHLMMLKAPGFSDADAHCGFHPNPLGHRCCTPGLSLSWPRSLF